MYASILAAILNLDFIFNNVIIVYHIFIQPYNNIFLY